MHISPSEVPFVVVVHVHAFSFFIFLKRGYLLYGEWCLDVFLLSSSLSENKHETVECVLLLCQCRECWEGSHLEIAGRAKLFSRLLFLGYLLKT